MILLEPVKAQWLLSKAKLGNFIMK